MYFLNLFLCLLSLELLCQTYVLTMKIKCGILDTCLISESRNVDTKILAVAMSIKVISCKKKSGTLDVKKCQIVDQKQMFFYHGF